MPQDDRVTFPFPFCLFSRGRPSHRLWPVAVGMASAMAGVQHAAAIGIVGAAVALREAFRFAKVYLMMLGNGRDKLRARGLRPCDLLRPLPMMRYTADISLAIVADLTAGMLAFLAVWWLLVW